MKDGGCKNGKCKCSKKSSEDREVRTCLGNIVDGDSCIEPLVGLGVMGVSDVDPNTFFDFVVKAASLGFGLFILKSEDGKSPFDIAVLNKSVADFIRGASVIEEDTYLDSIDTMGLEEIERVLNKIKLRKS